MSDGMIERDRYEGQAFFQEGEQFDMITGRLMSHDAKHWGWYAVNKLSGSDKVIPYTNPNTFETYDCLCAEFCIRRMKVDATKWEYMNIWCPIKGVEESLKSAFEHAMKVVDEEF